MHLTRRDKKDNLFQQLQERSIDMLQRLSGELWTDYNTHDPGVTILESLNYALYELQYRLDLPLAWYLSDPQTGQIPFERMGLLPLRRLFENSVVTASDYEQLFTSRIPAIAECRASFWNGGYDFTIYPQTTAADPDSLLQQAHQLFHAHRNLNERLRRIRIGPPRDKREGSIADCPKPGRPAPDAAFIREAVPYRSIQLDFPDTYGINRQGIPTRATDQHKARIRQLQAYLLIFDYLLSGATEQAQAFGSRLELSAHVEPVRWGQIGIPDIGTLVNTATAHREPEGSAVSMIRQRQAWFDLLDLLYGEDSRRYYSGQDVGTVLAKRAGLLRKFPDLDRDRFRSFNMLDMRSTTGIRKWTAALSGQDGDKELPLADLFSRYRMRLVPDSIFFRDYGDLLPVEFNLPASTVTDLQQTGLEAVPAQEADAGESDFQQLCGRLHFFRQHILFESMILHGSKMDAYGSYACGDGFLLLFHHSVRDKWLNLGFFTSREELYRQANVLCRFMQLLTLGCEVFYLVEHSLLHYPEEPPEEDMYRITILVPTWGGQGLVREQFEWQLQERLPAHADTAYQWLAPDQWFYVEKLYCDWRRALAVQNSEEILRAGHTLRLYLQ